LCQKTLHPYEYEKEICIKLSNFEARQLHAMGLGLTLYPEEMHYDYFPGEQTEDSKQIDKKLVDSMLCE